MGNLHKALGNIRLAIDFYSQSFQIRKRIGDSLTIANTKNNIGAVLAALGKTERAKGFYSKALQTKTAKLGADHTGASSTRFSSSEISLLDALIPLFICFLCRNWTHTCQPWPNLYKREAA